MTASPATAAERFRDRNITFANGSVGQNIDIPSANPRNYYQAISRPAEMESVAIDGKLFLPPGASGKGPLPLVIVVPGSLGVAPSHVTLNQIFSGMMPYMAVIIVCMIIMYIWPGMTLWLPNYLYGS